MTRGWLKRGLGRLWLEILLWRHGLIWPGVLVLLVAALALWLVLLPGGAQQLAQARAELQRLQSGQLVLALSTAERTGQEDAVLVAALDRVALSEQEVSEVLRRLGRIAQSKGLTLTETDFQATGEGLGGLRRLQLTLPLRAAYPQVRQFVEAVLLEFPGVSVDQMLLKRESVGQRQGEIRLRLSIWTNPAKSGRGSI
ncbi:GspMb/PilO family protein [Rhodoferax sp. BAB1]|uniref:GspMb/PilO family protein n=1 Tax=Rhodoferax sp. BAB1 TaxID=2741720 RepID=UPI0015750307|nr:GspMb/PilO family protein [Rhodoferax sp. BAB1]QKO21082.1 hypothetical protein HTY51_03900 [Rhodoferax sp. BAB1]